MQLKVTIVRVFLHQTSNMKIKCETQIPMGKVTCAKREQVRKRYIVSHYRSEQPSVTPPTGTDLWAEGAGAPVKVPKLPIGDLNETGRQPPGVEPDVFEGPKLPQSTWSKLPEDLQGFDLVLQLPSGLEAGLNEEAAGGAEIRKMIVNYKMCLNQIVN